MHGYVRSGASRTEMLWKRAQSGESFLFVVSINGHLRPFRNLTNTT